MSTTPTEYAPPLDRLLILGCPGCADGEQKFWRTEPFADYAAMGIGPEHIPELRRLVFDRQLANGDAPGSYGPVHAARALGALHPPELLADLIELTRRLDRDNDDAWLEDMPGVLARFGEMAIVPLAGVAADSREKFGARLYFVDALERIALEHPETRDRVVAAFDKMLKYAEYGHSGINAHIICSLLELRAVETLPAIRAAFATGRIDKYSCGPLEEIEEDIVLSPEERKARVQERIDRAEAELEAMSEEEAMAVMVERVRKMTEQMR